MDEKTFDEDKFTGEIRKFLKKVGINSQIEIENAVRAALAQGDLDLSKPLHARMLLEVPGVGLTHTIEHELVLE